LAAPNAREGADEGSTVPLGLIMRWSRLAVVLTLWALLVGLVALALYPELPRTVRGWLLIVIAGPALYVTVELIAEKALTRGAGLRMSAERFAWRRVVVALLVFLGIALLIAAALGM
jgi:hypothetical protein